jgi:PEP-CTERM motif
MSGKIRARTLVVQRLLLAAVFSLVLPLMAHANSGGIITITNTDGTPGTSAVGVMGPFSLTGSEVGFIGIYNQAGLLPTSTLSFTTGAYISGSLMNGGAMWSGTGSTFDITGYWNGNTGVIFSGSFSGNVSWVFNGCTKSNICSYELTGPVSGTWANGVTVSGQTTQIFFQFHGKYNGGPGLLDTGGTTSVVTPEPNSLGMMGAGLLAVGLVVKRKVKGQPAQND